MTGRRNTPFELSGHLLGKRPGHDDFEVMAAIAFLERLIRPSAPVML